MNLDIAKDLLTFWRDAGMSKWFRGGTAFDDECRTVSYTHLDVYKRQHVVQMAWCCRLLHAPACNH